MSFSAGDIEGTLTLDRSPFIRGLEQARKDAEQFARRRFTATVDADTDPAERKVESVARQLRDERGRFIARVQADTAPAKREIRAMASQLRDARGRFIRIDVDTGPATRGITSVRRQLAMLPREHEIDVEMHVDKMHGQIQRVLMALGSWKVAAVASIVALVPAAAAATAAIGGVSVAALATIPAFGAMAAAMVMAGKRGGPAFKELRHEVGHLRGAFENATGPAVRAAFGGLTDLVRSLTSVLPNLRENFTKLGEAMGAAFADLGRHLQTDRMVRFFQTMIDGSARAIGPLVDIFKGLLDVLANITQAAMPMFIRGLQRTAQWLGRMAEKTSDIDKLRDSLQAGARAGGEFWQIIRNLGDILASVWRAGRQPSADLVGAFEKGTRHLAEFFATAEGQDILRKTLESMVFFAEELMRALPTLIQMFGVILDIGRQLWTTVTGILNVIQKIPVVGPSLAAVGLAFAAWMGPIGLVRGALTGVIGLLRRIRRTPIAAPVVAGGAAGGRGGGGAVVAPINTGKATADARKAGSTAGRAGFIAGLVSAIAAGRRRVASTVASLTRSVGTALSRIPGLARIGSVIAAGFAAASAKVRTVVSRIGPMAAGVLRTGGRIVARGVFGWPGLIATVIYTSLPGKMRDAINRAVSSAFNAFVSAGRSLAQGMANGIASGASAVFNAALSIARSAWNAAKRFLGLRSPSRLFARAGRSVGQGLAEGIEEQRRKVQEIAQKLAEDAYRPIREAAKARLAMMDAEDKAREGPPLTRGQREADIYGRINEARFATDEQGRLRNQPPPGVQWIPSGEERELWQELADLRRSFEREDLEAAANVTIQALSPSDPRVLKEIQRSVGRSVRQGRRRRPRRSRRA